MKQTVLIVDDSALGKMMLSGILGKTYDVVAAGSGAELFSVLLTRAKSISAILLDLIMPDMDGYQVLQKIQENAVYRQIPIIVTSAITDEAAQAKALSYGATGYAFKPYQTDILLPLLANLINLREKSALANTFRKDTLTGLMNRSYFFEQAAIRINSEGAGHYILSCFDIEGFRVINDLYGMKTGDDVLKYIAHSIEESMVATGGICCRDAADKFGMLYPAECADSQAIHALYEKAVSPPFIDRTIRIRIGRYVVQDASLPVNAMYDRASLAEVSIKGRYDTYLADYDDAMLETLRHEQSIVGEMTEALHRGEFIPWFQPQYNHATGALIGAEALVRWNKGDQLVSPNLFIPLFERNGFIYQMDQSIWRQVCALLRRLINEGKQPLPVSVNVSRYDILQEGFVPAICSLVEEYRIPVELLRLEITESAFSESADTVIRVVETLIAYGFTIEIDDFGSGYSSLNTLKDVPAGILKLDMRFLKGNGASKRSGSILESVVRMAKWLGMSVIAEGVEERTQADYLKSIGCPYIQGYYYAKPMPMDQYEILLQEQTKEGKLAGLNTLDTLDSNEFWNPKSMETLIFNSYVGGAAIIEYHHGQVEPIRINDRFEQEFAGATKDGVPLYTIPPADCMDEENMRLMVANFHKAIQTSRESTAELCIYDIHSDAGSTMYLRCTVRMIAWTDDRYLLYCVVSNVTVQRLAEQRERGLYAEILDNLPCGAGLYEFDGTTLSAVHLNRQYWELVGREAAQYGTIDVMQPFHPDDRDKVLPEITDALLQKRDGVCDLRILCGDGSYRKFHIVVRIRKKKQSRYALYAFFMPATDHTLLLEEQNKSKREKNRLEFLFKNAAISVWSYNTKTGEILQNDRSRAMHGYGTVVKDVPESLVTSGYVHPDSVDEYLAMYAKLKNGEKEAEGVFRVRNASRTGYWFEHIRYAAISDDSTPELFFGISSDVSAEYEQDTAIHQWMTLVSEMQVEKNAICEYNLTTDSFVRKQGNLFPAFLFSKTDSFDAYILSWVRQCVFPEDADKMLNFLNRDKLLAMHGRGILDGGIDYRATIGGEIRWCSLSIKFIAYPSNEDVRLIMVHTDINARKEDELRLIEENRHDPMTGVLNRKAFEHQVNDIVSGEPNATHALFMIDLDNFKNINDTLGHITGDQVLKNTANGLHSLLRSDDLVGRIGGDEFMVFLKNIPNRDVIARRARMILEMMHTVINADVEVSGSLGIAIFPKDGANFDQLYRCADKAAYFSKQHGKNRSTFYDTDCGMDSAYGETTSEIDRESEAAMKEWDARTKLVMEENQRLIQRQEEDERYRLVIERTHITTFEWNAVTEKYAASPEFSEYVLSQQGGEQFFSENVDVSGIHPDDRALFYGKFLEKVLSGESAQETSLRLALKKGGYRWCRLGALVYFDKAERLRKAIGIITEENVQKKQSDVQLDAIFKFMSAGVLLLEIQNPDITALYISESYFRLENTRELTLSEGDALRFVHPDDYQKLRSKLFICSISGAVMEETFRVVHGKSVFWRHMHAVRIPYPDVSNPVMIAVETDITDIKRRQDQLEEQQGLIGAVFDELNVLSWYYYPQEHKAIMNNLCATAHHSPGEVLNVPASFIENGAVHPDDAEAFLALHSRIDSGEPTASAVIRVMRTDVGYVKRKIVYISVLDNGGKACCAIGVSEPINSITQ